MCTIDRNDLKPDTVVVIDYASQPVDFLVQKVQGQGQGVGTNLHLQRVDVPSHSLCGPLARVLSNCCGTHDDKPLPLPIPQL